MTVVEWQRIESIAIGALAFAAASLIGDWWWPLVLFLLFDLSAVGYLVNSHVGANLYNMVHSYGGPALILAWAGLAYAQVLPGASQSLAILGCSWAFHVAVDRALGYGLKHTDSFQHTHLGLIGRARRDQRDEESRRGRLD